MADVTHPDSQTQRARNDDPSPLEHLHSPWDTRNSNLTEDLIYTIVVRRVNDGHEWTFLVSRRVWCIVSNISPLPDIGQIYLGIQTAIIDLWDPVPMMLFVRILEDGTPDSTLPSRLVRNTFDKLENLIDSCAQQKDVLPYFSVYYQQEIVEKGPQVIRRLQYATMAAFWKGDHDAFETATRLCMMRLGPLDVRMGYWRLVPDRIRDRMLAKINMIKSQIRDRLKTGIQALDRDQSFFELLTSPGQCRRSFRQNCFQKNISEPAEELLNSMCMTEFQATLRSKCGYETELHRCTAQAHCPLTLNVSYVLRDVNNILESCTGMCFYKMESNDMAMKCSQCFSDTESQGVDLKTCT